MLHARHDTSAIFGLFCYVVVDYLVVIAAQDVLFSSSPIKLHRLVGWSDGSASSSDVAGMQVRVCGTQNVLGV